MVVLMVDGGSDGWTFVTKNDDDGGGDTCSHVVVVMAV